MSEQREEFLSRGAEVWGKDLGRLAHLALGQLFAWKMVTFVFLVMVLLNCLDSFGRHQCGGWVILY